MVNALFDSKRRNALRQGLASGDLRPLLRRQVEAPEPPSQIPNYLIILDCVPMAEAIMRAESQGEVMVSNKDIDSIIRDDNLRFTDFPLPFWTGTMVACVEPGKTFREGAVMSSALKSHVIEFFDDKSKEYFLFPVPDRYLDKQDSVLVVNHPDFRLESDAPNWIVRAGVVDMIEKLPAVGTSWHHTDPKYGIPFGADADHSDPDARHITRPSSTVTLVSRVCRNDRVSVSGRCVSLSQAPSNDFGVVVYNGGAK